jgi:hypothetical protein
MEEYVGAVKTSVVDPDQFAANPGLTNFSFHDFPKLNFVYFNIFSHWLLNTCGIVQS